MGPTSLPDPFYLIIVLALLTLAPFVAVMITSFIKMVVVFSLIRNALGIQQIPPNMVINGLAIILTFYVMSPVGQEVFDRVREIDTSTANLVMLEDLVEEARKPVQAFLKEHSHDDQRLFFLRSAQKIWPEEKARDLQSDDLTVLVPSFAVSELTSAFEIGFLLYLPFIAIDLIVANVLMAMGMMMVSPMTISLPFKLLLFVLLDGWTRLIHGLVLTYQ